MPFGFSKKKKEVQVVQKGPALSCVHYGVCSEGKCPMWVILENTITDEGGKVLKKDNVGRCAIAWIPQMTIELKMAVKELKTK